MKKLSEAPSVYVAGEPLPEDSLLVAKFDLPPELAWFNELNVQERINFFVGLLEVLAKPELTLPDGRQRTHMDAINEYLRGWQATVELESSPEAMESHGRALDDAKRRPSGSALIYSPSQKRSTPSTIGHLFIPNPTPTQSLPVV